MFVIKRITIIICVVSLMMTTSILSSLSVASPNTVEYYHPYNSQSFEDHIIEGVPYVGQATHFYCAYAAITMIFNYYEMNTSLNEVLHHSGVGYSLAYTHYLFPARTPWGGYELSQSPSATSFLASLYNLSFTYSVSEDWEDYWPRVKQNITNDIPIMTSVNHYAFPYYKDLGFNGIGGHAIVVVGFNQTHVFYNDPATSLYTGSDDGTYANITIDIFKEAVNTTAATSYLIYTFENHSSSSTTKEERFERAHKRNIKLMNGDLGAYLGLNLPVPFPLLGVQALKAFKKDLRVGITRRMTTIYLGRLAILQNVNVSLPYYRISIEKHNISQYLHETSQLLEDEHLSLICEYDASLLQQESSYWENMSLLFSDLSDILRNNKYLKALIYSFPITFKMKRTLKEMISIEKAIIIGPTE